MRTIIAGSRGLNDEALIDLAVKQSGFKVTTVFSGRASGIDKAGERWAKKHKIPIKLYPADWNKYGNSAGYVRNSEMAEAADALIAIWDHASHGTHNMIRTAINKKLKVFVITVSDGKAIY